MSNLRTCVLSASKNNTLFQNPSGDTSDGAGPTIFVGCQGREGNNIRRGTLAFDPSAAIPRGSKIVSAALTLTLHQTPTLETENIALHRALADWGEASSSSSGGSGAPAAHGDATWLFSFFNTTRWIKEGGDFVNAASASQPVGLRGPYTWKSANMAADVQVWLDAPDSNFGWVLVGNESATGTLKVFASRHSHDRAPKLSIEYEPPSS